MQIVFRKLAAAAGLAFFFFSTAVWANSNSNDTPSSNTQAIEAWIQKNVGGGGNTEDFSKKIGEIQGALASLGSDAPSQIANALESSKVDSPPPAPARTMTAEDQENYRLQAGDKLTIKIFPEDPYVKGGDMQVSPDGNVTLPLMGKVPLVGKTINEAQESLRQILDRDYLVDPEVKVEVIENKERSFVVLGQVKKPGTYQFPAGVKSFSLLEAISQAGGFSDIANIKKIKVLRQQGDKGSVKKVIQANAEAIIAGQEADIELEEGDVINVLESLF